MNTYINNTKNTLKKALFYLRRAFLHVFSDIRTKDSIVFIVPIVTIIYFGFFLMPVFIDEAWTTSFFVGKPFTYGLTHYPEPNNHVLFTIILNIAESLSIFDLLATMRLPVVIGSIFTYFLIFSFVKSYLGEKSAILVTGISSMLLYFVLYAFMARGYFLQLLFFIIGLYSVFNILKANRKKDWCFFVISSVLGLYTIPSYLYAFVILNLILLYDFRQNYKRIICAGLITGFCTVLLYSPIILHEGLNALTNNSYILTLDRSVVLSKLPDFYMDMFCSMTGLNIFIILAVLVVSFVLILKSKDKRKIYLFSVFILSPFVLLLLHSVIPFFRTFNYYNFLLVFIFVAAISKYIDRLPKRYVLVFTICIQLVLLFNFYNKREQPSMEFGREYAWYNVYNQGLSNSEATYYTNSWWVLYQLYFQISIVNHNTEALHIEWLKDINADTLANYNYILLHKGADKTALRKPTYSDEFINIYVD